ncbi:MAG TPA: ABC transporter ATP-binding protein, partial [Saprospiraceae bacterium]|nr:ABC transporter ATP-binding protein [Saprospiraceae bacterium]
MMSKEEILVDVSHVSKKFSRSLNKGMWYGLKDLGSAVFGSNQDRSILRDGEFWSVKDVSFSLRRGECLGLIGRNGAGKSTLLKMLNGLIRPDEGTITMRGKIGALIELSAGFNPLLSGRENVYVNGQLLGFSKKEIDQKFKTIIDFAEIGEFIDSPVQNYSSGMKVRLGFAVAAQMEPDVLLIDEVLAVGDMGFVLKCLNKMDELRTKT